MFVKSSLPDYLFNEDFYDKSLHYCLIIDDGIEVLNDKKCASLFFRISHHQQVSILMCLQLVLSSTTPSLRQIYNNVTHVCIFRISIGIHSLAILTARIFGKELKDRFIHYYKKHMESSRYNYIIIDLHTTQ